MIFQLARRNLVRRRRTSLTILSLFAGIIMLFFIGNSILGESSRGLEKNYIRSFTGDLIISPPTTVEVSLFGALTPSIGEYYAMPSLEDYNEINSLLRKDSRVADTTGIIIGAAALDAKGIRDNVPFFGIDGDDYFSFFPDLMLIEGSFLSSGQEGIMITSARADKLEKETGRKPEIGGNMKISLYGGGGFKIREIPLRGIISYYGRNEILDKIVLIDLQTARALNSLNLALDEKQIINKKNSFLLDAFSSGDPDSLLTGDFFYTENTDSADEIISTPQENNNSSKGAFHFLLVKLFKKGSFSQKELNDVLKDQNITGVALNWRQGAGLSAQLVLLLQLFYNAGLILVSMAGIIAMVNIFLISIFERTNEIGTLRALGAQKAYISRLLLMENLILSFFGAILGVGTGMLLMIIISHQNITISNDLFISLLGRDTIQFTPRIVWIITSLLLSLFLGTMATLFPLRKAMSIEPSTAQRKESS